MGQDLDFSLHTHPPCKAGYLEVRRITMLKNNAGKMANVWEVLPSQFSRSNNILQTHNAYLLYISFYSKKSHLQPIQSSEARSPAPPLKSSISIDLLCHLHFLQPNNPNANLYHITWMNQDSCPLPGVMRLTRYKLCFNKGEDRATWWGRMSICRQLGEDRDQSIIISM